MPDITLNSAHSLHFMGKTYRCAIGENGLAKDKKEGDKKTPIGSFFLRECWYRADRIDKPDTGLPLKVIQPEDGWCDDPASNYYNTHVVLPFAPSHEILWREDAIYDILIPIGYNDEHPVKGQGSAIFFHLATPDYKPTLGCVGIALRDMLEIMKYLNSESRITI